MADIIVNKPAEGVGGCIKTVEFFIPGKPVATPRPKVCVRGKHPAAYYPKHYEEWKKHCRSVAKDAAMKRRIGCHAGPVSAGYRFLILRAESNKTDCHTQKPDLDNLIKGAQDGIEGVFFNKDSQIDHYLECFKEWCFSCDDEGVIVTLKFL